jgi:hypothetical protein
MDDFVKDAQSEHKQLLFMALPYLAILGSFKLWKSYPNYQCSFGSSWVSQLLPTLKDNA